MVSTNPTGVLISYSIIHTYVDSINTSRSLSLPLIGIAGTWVPFCLTCSLVWPGFYPEAALHTLLYSVIFFFFLSSISATVCFCGRHIVEPALHNCFCDNSNSRRYFQVVWSAKSNRDKLCNNSQKGLQLKRDRADRTTTKRNRNTTPLRCPCCSKTTLCPLVVTNIWEEQHQPCPL